MSRGHVVIGPSDKGGWRVTIDGHDIAHMVSRDGINISFRNGRAVVTLEVLPQHMDADLPDAVLATLAPPPELDETARQPLKTGQYPVQLQPPDDATPPMP